MLIRLQAENKKRKPSSYASDESRIAKAAKILPTFGPTEFKLSFIKARESSYEAHLENCSDFLLTGPGIWWLTTVRTYDENDNLKEIVSNDDQESSGEDQTLTGLEEVNADVFQLVPTPLEESNDDNMGI